jgi:hypothetical protein
LPKSLLPKLFRPTKGRVCDAGKQPVGVVHTIVSRGQPVKIILRELLPKAPLQQVAELTHEAHLENQWCIRYSALALSDVKRRAKSARRTAGKLDIRSRNDKGNQGRGQEDFGLRIADLRLMEIATAYKTGLAMTNVDSRLRGNDNVVLCRPFGKLPASPETAGLPTSLKLRRTSRRASRASVPARGN